MKHSMAIRFRQKLTNIVMAMDNENALDNVELFPAWCIKSYALADRVQYDGKLYECVQAHTSQETWTPDITPALWKRVMIEEYPEWVQPTGAQDAYRLGDKVTHNGLRWISDYDNNTWEPGVYGWAQIE